MNADSAWEAVDHYLTDTLVRRDDALDATLAANAEAELPPHDVSPAQGKFLMLLCRMTNARTVLEIGTLGGYSTIWLARGLPDEGRVVSLESDEHHAGIARGNLSRAGLLDRVDIVVGPALETLPTLLGSSTAPFDVVFIDADKPNNPQYLDWALRLTKPGSVIIGDNVVRDGQVADGESEDERARGVRRFLELLRDDPRVDATALQTVGVKGWDGFALGRSPTDDLLGKRRADSYASTAAQSVQERSSRDAAESSSGRRDMFRCCGVVPRRRTGVLRRARP